MTKVVYVGLDVHKDSITVALARTGREAAETWKTIPYDGVRLVKALRMLVKGREQLRVCYEAGPTGFGLCRRLREAGIDCIVVAPSLVPGKAGDRVKTDRRDARKLAHFLRSGDLTPVYVPDESVEAIRDLERARDDAKCAERVARHQLSKFLLRHDRHWDGTTWTVRHRDWIRTQKFAYPAQQRVLEDYLKTVEDLAERVERLTARNVSTCLRHLHVEISVVWSRFASSFLWTWGPAPTPPGFFEAWLGCPRGVWGERNRVAWGVRRNGARLCGDATWQGIVGSRVRRRCIGLLGTAGCQEPFFVVVRRRERRIDPHGLGEWKRGWRLPDETLRMGRIGGVEHVLSASKDLGRLAVVDHRRRQQTES
jgi:hypothetical protein